MLQVYVYGPIEQGFLDVDPDAQLEMEGVADIFDEDLTTGEYSLPVDFPWTEKNRRLLGFAERIENFKSRQPFWKCTVFSDGFPEMESAKLTLLEKVGKFTYLNGKFSTTITGTKGLFGSLIKDKMMKDLQLGGRINWQGKNSRQFATAVMKGEYPQYNYLAFATVAIEGFFGDDADYFLAKDAVNFANITGAGADDWEFDSPAGAYAKDFRTVPFFNLKYVLRKIFEENGFEISGDFIDNDAFNDIYLFNNCGIENYTSTGIDFNRFITPADHMENKKISDWLKAVFSAVNVYPVFSGTNKVQLYHRAGELRNRRVFKIDHLCSDSFSSTFEDVSEQKGYKLSFSWDEKDEFHSERVKDLKDKTLVASVVTRDVLFNLNIGRQLTTDDIAYVEADNLFYQVADATGLPILWDVYAEKLQEYIVGDGQRNVDLGLSTLCTYVELNTVSNLFEKQPYVGTRQPGSFQNDKGIKISNDFATRIFYIKKLSRGGVMVPTSFNHNRNDNNQVIERYSLSWYGADGLAANFHTNWQDMRENVEIVKTMLRIDQKVLQQLATSNSLEHNGVVYLPYKFARTIPIRNNMEVQMVPI